MKHSEIRGNILIVEKNKYIIIVQQNTYQAIGEEHRKGLIRIFFALIIAVGFNDFIIFFLFPELINASNIFEAKISLPELSFTDVFLPILFNMLFFFVTLFWFLCHWIFYHELIQKYPYYRWRKFFVDIAIFALMFMILSTSYQIYVKDKDGNFKIKNFHLFMLLIISWYILAILWHLSDRKLRTLRWHLRAHYWRLGTFIALFFLSFKWSSSLVYHLLFESFLSYETYEEGIRYVIMVIVMGAIIGYSIKRLTMFIRKNERVSLQCCLFYNNDELIPCLMNYKQQPYEPQSIASDLIIKTSKNLERGYNRRELWNDILNYCSRDLVEYLILYYLQKKNINMSLLFEIEKRLKEKNIFRVSLSDLQLGSTTGKSNNALLTIGRHESNIKSEIYPQTDFEKTDSRMIVLKGRYFTVEIKYKKAESFPSSLDFMPNDIDPEIIKQILANNFCANSSNTKVITFTIEFDATVNTLSRISAFFSFGSAPRAEQEIEWLNELQRDFKQFFSIIDFSIIDE